MHVGLVPVHIPEGRQVLMWDPNKVYPVMQTVVSTVPTLHLPFSALPLAVPPPPGWGTLTGSQVSRTEKLLIDITYFTFYMIMRDMEYPYLHE